MNKLALLLSLSQFSYKDQKVIMDSFSHIDLTLPLDEKRLHQVCGLSQEKIRKMVNAKEQLPSFEEELHHLQISWVDITSMDYPKRLLALDQPPVLLYYQGDLALAEQMAIGIIGSRKPTVYGIYCAHLFGKGLGERQVLTASGLAAGIDSLSQKATLEGGGKTIAVLGSPLSKIYPHQNRHLAKEIIQGGGLLLSEYSHRDQTMPYFFVARNRIIAALSTGLLIVEAGLKSGTLTTVDFALDLGRDIFSIPGNINSPLSMGTNAMIKNGAIFVTQVEDILNYYQISDDVQTRDSKWNDISAKEMDIVKLLQNKGPMHAESIAYALKDNIKDIIGILSVLEIKSIVVEVGNKVYSIQ